jgi:predicted nucleic-acid-binding Zn-ribbon protein
MFFGLFADTYERTCQECGYSWQVPRSIARYRTRGISAVTVIGASRGDGGGGLSSVHSGIASRAEAMEGYRICAKCGVDNFTQRPVRRAS